MVTGGLILYWYEIKAYFLNNLFLIMTAPAIRKKGYFIFNQVFDLVRQWPYHGLTDWVFSFFISNTFSTLIVSDHITVSQTGLKKFGLWDCAMVIDVQV